MKQRRAIWVHARRGLLGAMLSTSLGAASLAQAHEDSDLHPGSDLHQEDRKNHASPEAPLIEQPEEPSAFATTPIHPSLAERHEALAQAALHRMPDSEHHFGLVMTVAERTSDLPWILAIENRGEHDVQLAALPLLLSLEVSPPPPRSDSSASKEPSSSGEQSTSKVTSVRCGSKAPGSLKEDETLLLPSGGMLVYSFDVRELCEDPAVLKEGSVVTVRYGFPTQTKKLWQGGKLVEVEAEQTSPFVAEDPRSEREETKADALVSLKQLETTLPPLDFTYPLDAFEESIRSAAREADAARKQGRKTASFQGAASSQEESSPETPPLRVTLSPLGKTSRPEDGIVQVRIENVSAADLRVYIRREHLSYRVLGPSGTTTCRMHPTNPSASGLSFSSLSPGEGRTLTTRLAEACPAGVWATPGEYVVAALFSPNESGALFDIEAYVGEVQSANLARLTVLGGKQKDGAAMRVVRLSR